MYFLREYFPFLHLGFTLPKYKGTIYLSRQLGWWHRGTYTLRLLQMEWLSFFFLSDVEKTSNLSMIVFLRKPIALFRNRAYRPTSGIQGWVILWHLCGKAVVYFVGNRTQDPKSVCCVQCALIVISHVGQGQLNKLYIQNKITVQW